MTDQRLADMAQKRAMFGMAPTKEELKMKEREDQLKKEAETAELAKRRKLETEAVRKEVGEHRKAIDQLNMKFKRSGENILNWFTMTDSNKDGFMEPNDLKGLLQRAGVNVTDQNLLKVFEVIDLQQTGRINYNDFVNVVQRNIQLPLEQIVRKRRKDKGESLADHIEEEIDPEEKKRIEAYKSYQAEVASKQDQDIGSVKGLSQIMRMSEDNGSERHFIDDEDSIHLQNEVKEMLRVNFIAFEDILQKMGAPTRKTNVVTLKDFETVIRSMPASTKYSNQQIKNLYMTHARKGVDGEFVIQATEFKDKFFPGIPYKLQPNLRGTTETQGDGKSSKSGGETSQTRSMHIDNVLAGLKHEDLDKAFNDFDAPKKPAAKPSILKQKEQKYKAANIIQEDALEKHSHSSQASIPMDDILGGRTNNPRRGKNEPGTQLQLITEESRKRDQIASPTSNQLSVDNMNKFKQNMDFFRQHDAMEKKIAFEDRFRFDRSLDMFFKQYCRAIIKEVQSGPVKKDVTSYVQFYGKETAGFINYSEFKEIYVTHVAPNIAAEESAL